MPLSKYFGGHGEKVMKDMKKKHGDKKGKSIFYATSNKKKKDKKGGLDVSPSDKVKKKFNFN
jgi:hypothetical protein